MRKVDIGVAPYIQMERNDMEVKIIYGTDEKGRIYSKNQLEGEVLAIHRWKSKQHYIDGKPAAKITKHSHGIGNINVSSGNSHHKESMPNIMWSSELPSPLLTVADKQSNYSSIGLRWLNAMPWMGRVDIDLGPATRAILNDE